VTKKKPSRDDIHHMRAALGLAKRGLGDVWPNPAVGCVLVREDQDGIVVGRGWTGSGGRPHAETEALRRAGEAASGATAYITLEPCSHHGETPPCADALVNAGVARAVVAIEDPNPQVAGKGLQRMTDAGIVVSLGTGGAEAQDINAGFFLRISEGRPLFTLKTASTLDGRIAAASGESRWITSDAARSVAHKLRAEHDGIMVGIGTALADDPQLTCRLPGMEARSPVRIVVDSNLRLPLDSRLAVSAKEHPVWLITGTGAPREQLETFRSLGVTIIEAEFNRDGRVSLRAAARELGSRGLTRVLVEGGGTLAAALLKEGLVDRLAWFQAPKLMGSDGVPAAGALQAATVAEAHGFTRSGLRQVGPDLFETFTRVT